MLKDVFAVCILVDNLSASKDFYENKLGLELNSEDTGFVDFKTSGTSVALFEKKHATAMFSTEHMKSGGGFVLAFKVEDINETCDRLVSKGVTIFEGPKETSWGQKVAYCKDPDSNIIEITE